MDKHLWPADGDTLFSDGGKYETNAHTCGMKSGWMFMAEGYARAAELAVKNCSRKDRDHIVYPVVYLYRHSIELALKYTINIAQSLLTQSEKTAQSHSLLGLWESLRLLLDQQWPTGPLDVIDTVESMLKELHKADCNAQIFRFPCSLKEKPHFDSDANIDMVKFVESGRKILNFLDGCSTAMHVDLDARNNLASDCS